MKILPSYKIVALRPTSLPASSLGGSGGSGGYQSVIEVVEKNLPETGEVVAIGRGKLPVPFKVGSIVAYRKFGEFKFWLGGKEIIFVKFEDILGVLK